MPFALAPTFWRQLANVSRGSIDINEVDSTTAKVLDIIRGAPKVAAGDPGLFRSIVPRVLRFKTALTDMREVELIPGGRSVEVTLENCEEYRRRLIATRLGEASAQIAALRAGLAEVIPLPLLQLFTWQETERLPLHRERADAPSEREERFVDVRALAQLFPVVARPRRAL